MYECTKGMTWGDLFERVEKPRFVIPKVKPGLTLSQLHALQLNRNGASHNIGISHFPSAAAAPLF